MTREKAVNTLKAMHFIVGNEYYSDNVEEAINMAIEALETPNKPSPCPQCWSKKIKTRYKKPYTYVYCDNCGLRIWVADEYEEADGKEEAIAIWNKRSKNWHRRVE